jgi:glucose uptake protein
MILPQSYGAVLLLMVLALLCWGSWANTYKLAGKHRFELYYLDFALGFLVMALILAFTVGNIGFDGFSLFDDLEHSGKRQWLYGFMAGVVFNFGNMFLLSSVAVGGMAMAFTASFGAAMIMSSLLRFIITPSGSLMLIVAGWALLAAAVIVMAGAHHILGVIRHEELARAGKTKSTRRPSSMKGVVLGLVSGLILGSFFPLIQKATETEVGLGPYAVMALFALGVFLSTVMFDLFFMNLPVEGDPIEPTDYLRVTPRQHLLGFAGGAMWCGAAVASLVAAVNPNGIHLPLVLNYFLDYGFPLLAILWGIFAWRELRGGDARVRIGSAISFVLFAGALLVISLAPLSAQKG